MKVNELYKRVFTKELENSNKSVYDLFDWQTVDVSLKDYRTGKTSFEMKGLEFPKSYSQNACNIIASKYFRKEGVSCTGHETSMRQVADRMVGFWADALQDEGLIENDDQWNIFYDEMVFAFLSQMWAPNSPQWFNTGIFRNYGIIADSDNLYYYDPNKKQVVRSNDRYTRTQASACFILSIKDQLLGEGSISDHYVSETKLFKGGSGVGTNFSPLRGTNEKLSSGGKSSGMMSFLQGLDRNAGAIKSGGTTRRAAKMVIADIDHPEIEDFIGWKAHEEQKVRDLGKMGYDTSMDGEAYQTVSGQNANNSVRVNREFMDKVMNLDKNPDATFKLKGRIDKSVNKKVRLFATDRQNDREKVMKNTYELNELLHKKDIDEKKRSQFVGTCLLFVKSEISKIGGSGYIDKIMIDKLDERWSSLSESVIRAGVEDVLNGLLDGTNNKTKKIELLQRNVLNDQKVKKLTLDDWIEILNAITAGIYKYIDADSSEGQDILNLFFITFNKYTGKADKNQAFTPDHITDFMTQLTGVNRNSRVLDVCCGSGSFLVQAMVKELADCRRGRTETDAKILMNEVKENHIFGIEVEENAYGLATTNMLIHGDGNSNIEFGSCFDKENFIKKANPDIVLMNPPYNAKPRSIPEHYKTTWTAKEKNGKEDPTKGLVFIQYLSDVFKRMNKTNIKLAVLLPMSAAIGTSKRIAESKIRLLKDNTLEAVFSLPAEVFYPGASVQACCMLFTMGIPHDSKNHETFFGYYKDDGFKKKKNLGRVEQFDNEGHSYWKRIEEKWLSLYKNKKIVDGLTAMKSITGNDEWLCEAYMRTDFSKISINDFEQTINGYLAYLVGSGNWKWLNKYLQIKNQRQESIIFDINQWKEFTFGELIDNIYKAKAHTKEEVEECEPQNPKAIPFVSRTEPNNSVDFFVLKTDNMEGIESGNALVVGDTTATVSYQDKAFVTGDHIVVIRADWLNLYTGLFVTCLLRKEHYRYSYGRAFVMDSIKNTIIKMPTDNNGNADWEWIEKFMKSLPSNFSY